MDGAIGQGIVQPCSVLDRLIAGWSRCPPPEAPAGESCRPTGWGCPKPPWLPAHGHRSAGSAADLLSLLHETSVYTLLSCRIFSARKARHSFVALVIILHPARKHQFFVHRHNCKKAGHRASHTGALLRGKVILLPGMLRPWSGCGLRAPDGTHGGSGRSARGTDDKNSWCSRNPPGQ